MTRRLAIALIAGSAAGLPIRAAHAAVTQLDGTVLPQPSSAAELSVVTSRGFPSTADTLAGLFQSFAGGVDRGLDSIADASTTPGTFDPRCGLRVSVVLRGGGCQNALGWYNATQPPQPPSASDIHTVVPSDLTGVFPNGIGCLDPDFCPLASRDTTAVGQHTWADPLPAFDPQITASSSWKGGRVGFALVANASRCTQTKYSEAALNGTSTAYAAPWVTALIYPSGAAPGAVYLAFEDSPMPMSDWKQSGADGDFNDAVYIIAPVPCPDGGAADASAADASVRRDASADGAVHRDAGRDSSATGGAGGAAGAGGGAGRPGSGGMSSSGGGGGPGGQTSATGGQVSTGGAAGSPGKPAGSGGGCGCQSADGSVTGLLRWLIVAALAGLRRRGKRPQITRP